MTKKKIDMKTLEEEARNVLKEKEKVGYSYEYYDGFIAGANSKWVQAEKIKAQIDILKLAHLRLSVEGIDKADDTMVFTVNE